MDVVRIACLLRGLNHPDSKKISQGASIEEIWEVVAKEFSEKGMEQQAYTIIGYNPQHFSNIVDYFPKIFKALLHAGFFRIVDHRLGKKAIPDVTVDDEHWGDLFLSEPEDIYIAYKLGARTSEELSKLARSVNYLRKKHSELPHFWRNKYEDLDITTQKVRELFEKYKERYVRKERLPPAIKSGIKTLISINERMESVPDGWRDVCDVKTPEELIETLCKLSSDYTSYRNHLVIGTEPQISTDIAREDISIIENVLNSKILKPEDVLNRTTLLLNLINDFIKDAIIKIREGFELEDIVEAIYARFYDLPDFRFIGFGKLL